MEWTEQAIVLSARPSGESAAVLEVLTADHGRHAGFVRGGRGRRKKGLLQAGNILQVTWKARLEENLGAFTLELIHSPLGAMFGEGGRLQALSAIMAVLQQSLPERDPHPALYHALASYMEVLEASESTALHWAMGLAQFEKGLLAELGYALDLSVCAVSGSAEELIYVSPKTGKAVSSIEGKAWQDKLLKLPYFLSETGQGNPDGNSNILADAMEGLTLTGYFLTRQIWAVHNKAQPPARDRFIHWLMTQSNNSSFD